MEFKNSYIEITTRIFKAFPSFQKVGSKAYHPGLSTMLEFEAMCDNPHNQYKCIHVAGTNGKGSVSNMLAAALASQGLKVGLYTSPHLLDMRERIRIILPRQDSQFRNNDTQFITTDETCSINTDKELQYELISEEELIGFYNKWEDAFQSKRMSFFEITTAMAFWWFAYKKVDIAVIETGLGGRLDSTNIITPVLSVITNIGLDHCNILGETLEQIAWEKAGIIKKNIDCILGESKDKGVRDVFIKEAKDKGCNLFFADDSCSFNKTFTDNQLEESNLEDIHINERLFDEQFYEERTFEKILNKMDLQGCYQRPNLRTVLCALSRLFSSDGALTDCFKNIDKLIYAIKHTARITGFRGRWEKVCDNPKIIADIGHNEHGLKYNFAQLEQIKKQYNKLIIIYGSVADKDWHKVVDILPKEALVIFTAADSPRSVPAREVYEYGKSIGMECAMSQTVADAVNLALELAKDSTVSKADADIAANTLVYIGGSTFVVSEALKQLL